MSDCKDIDNPVQIITDTGSVSGPPGEEWVATTTNTNTPLCIFNNLVIDPNEEVVNISQNILDDKELKFYPQVISGPCANLWYAAIEFQIHGLRHNHSWNVVDRPTNRKLVDAKWVIKIKCLSTDPLVHSTYDYWQRDCATFRDRITMRRLHR
jgi:hypothetical protein